MLLFMIMARAARRRLGRYCISLRVASVGMLVYILTALQVKKCAVGGSGPHRSWSQWRC